MTDTTALRDLLVNARAEIELMKRGLAELERRLVIQECMEHGRPIPGGINCPGRIEKEDE